MYARSRRVKAEDNRHGLQFDSGDELKRYEYLLLRRAAHEIGAIEHHPRFDLVVADIETGDQVLIGFYEADFRYFDYALRDFVVEDVKGAMWIKKQSKRRGVVVREWKERAPILDDVYKLKKKIVEARYGIRIIEVWDGQQH